MRKLILFITIINFAPSAFAQEYHLIPDSNAAWQIRFWIGPGNPYVYYYYYMDSTNNDTTINSNIYGKLYAVQQGPDTTYVGALRENNVAQVYFCPKDSINEYLIYDFSKNVGDSVHVYSFNYVGAHPERVDMKVALKDSVLLANKYQRYLELSNATFWVEGAGSRWGLLEDNNLSVSGTTELICMSYNDTIWSKWFYTVGKCSLILESVTEKFTDNYFSIYPNPSQSQFTIEMNTGHPSLLEIYNIVGERIYSEPIKQKRTLINCENISSGIYFVKVRDNESEYIKKLMVQRTTE